MTELAPRLGLAVVRLARHLRQQNEGELTQTLHSALATIDRVGPMSLGELATAEHVAAPTVTKLVARLAELGYVERTTDPNDRRVVLVAVTAAGRRLLDTNRRRRATWLARRLGELTDEERLALEKALGPLDRLNGSSSA